SEGVNYEVNIGKETGSRIENLTWPDGTPLRDDDVFEYATNNYTPAAHLLAPGDVYEADDMPVITGMDLCSDIGGIRELIGDCIVNVKGGVITPECSRNWKLTGYEWDQQLHDKAVEQCASGILEIPSSEDGRNIKIKAIREEDLQ
ncbi:MAG: 5'-nucleotidase C-terminal domain-containing protein, partial [Solobacterium sp.]|nr:5'-nucleotidase C-terminal domain-containing protein [Solobacterium sp.]